MAPVHIKSPVPNPTEPTSECGKRSQVGYIDASPKRLVKGCKR